MFCFASAAAGLLYVHMTDLHDTSAQKSRFLKTILFVMFVLTDLFMGTSILGIIHKSPETSSPTFFMCGVLILGQMVYFVNELIKLFRKQC
jgi:hypothetical protein